MTRLMRDILVGIAFAGGVLAVVLGSFGLGTTQARTIDVPGPVVTVTAPAPSPVTVTVAPAACASAIKTMDAIIVSESLLIEEAVNGTSAAQLSDDAATMGLQADYTADATACVAAVR